MLTFPYLCTSRAAHTGGCLGHLSKPHTQVSEALVALLESWRTSRYGGKSAGSRVRLEAWLPTACSSLQGGRSFSVFTWPFFSCFYELISLLLCSPPFLSTHTPLWHLILIPWLPLASHLPTRLPPPSPEHQPMRNLWNVPRKLYHGPDPIALSTQEGK